MIKKELLTRNLPFKISGILSIGVLSIGTAAILIRMADAHPLTIAAYRMLIASIVVTVFGIIKRDSFKSRITPRDWALLLMSGAFLASHFALWITSLQTTSLANSVFFVTTTPIFVMAGSYFLGERATVLIVFAIAITFIGGIVLAFGDDVSQKNNLYGDGLALAGAVAMAGNLLIGRYLRSRIRLVPYITTVYFFAALILIVCAILVRAPMFGLSLETYLWVLLAALIPQAIGHSALNWALEHVSATTVSMVTRIEPAIAIFLGILFFREVPHWTVIPGGIFLLIGVGLIFRAEVTEKS